MYTVIVLYMYIYFNLHILNGKWCWIFSYVYLSSRFLFGEISIHDFCWFYNWIFLNFGFWRFFTYARYKIFISYVICNILSKSAVLFFSASLLGLSQFLLIDQGFVKAINRKREKKINITICTLTLWRYLLT